MSIPVYPMRLPLVSASLVLPQVKVVAGCQKERNRIEISKI